MSQTNNLLNNSYGLGAGVTPHYAITYDDSLSAADGVNRANGLVADCEGDYNWMSNLFGNIGIPFPLPVSVQLSPGAFASAGWGPPITVTPGDGQPVDLVRYLLVSEVVEMMMDQKDNGWGYSYGDTNEGSKGEALSRFLGYQFMASNNLNTSLLNQAGGTFFVANDWLSTTTRTDFVNLNPDDNHPDATTGCTTLFVYYLYVQLQFKIPDIINAGSRFLSGVYNSLTGDPGDPFPFFKRLLDNTFPGTATLQTGPDLDNPFPLGLLSFWADQNTFGRDQIQDLINTQSGVVSNAFWLVLEGFSINAYQALNITIPNPTGTFLGLQDITVSATPAMAGGPTPPAPIAQFEDPTNLKAPQRIRFSFDITFASTKAFPAAGTSPISGELDANAQVNGKPLLGATASALFELIGGENPYFTNIDPTNQGDVFYLSQDLRVFSVTAGVSPLTGAPAFTTDPYASIQSLIGYLNGAPTYTSFPAGSDPLNALPGQIGYETGDSSVTPTNAQGNQNYNFALARVRLRGAPGAQAANTRVFFRLFVAQSCDTDFQPNTTYLSTLGTSGPDLNLPVFPQPSGTGITDPSGQTLQTIPFFATSAAGTHDYDGTLPNANIQSIIIRNNADSVCAYFGCYLDVYNANNNSKFGGTHHCVVGEIAYDGAPIPTMTSVGTTPTPANWDQLAQRNLQITSSENPKSAATHVVSQAFDTRPSKALATSPVMLLDLPDELMIDWGNTPLGSTASIYWPQLNAGDVIGLANQVYSSHLLWVTDTNTLQCTVTKGVTYIPIPAASAVNFAGLLTIDLPTDIVNRQEFNVVIRRVSTRRPLPARQTIQTRARKAGETAAPSKAAIVRTPSNPTNWRQVNGSFQVRIPVTTKEVMLRPEENMLAVLKWRLEQMSPIYRWYPVLKQYVSLVAARVDGLGGYSANVPPSLGGYLGATGESKPLHVACEGHTGKVTTIVYDRFGDFEGFLLCVESGEEIRFRGHEQAVENLIRLAWEERWVITVESRPGHPRWPTGILLR